MASIGIQSGRNFLHPIHFFPQHKPNRFSSSNPFLLISSKPKKFEKHILSASIAASIPALAPHPHDPHAKDAIFHEKIDSWMQESVSEIVKNLKRAPLLVQIYSENDDEEVKVRTETALLDNWAVLKDEWRNGDSKAPDGLIFVEELGHDDGESLGGEGVSRAWGIVVQGKGVECGPACYLLKTNRVCAGMGLGFCTHFCLMRVSNLRDSALEQFRDSWLLQ